jgi:hypothetical protein
MVTRREIMCKDTRSNVIKIRYFFFIKICSFASKACDETKWVKENIQRDILSRLREIYKRKKVRRESSYVCDLVCAALPSWHHLLQS